MMPRGLEGTRVVLHLSDLEWNSHQLSGAAQSLDFIPLRNARNLHFRGQQKEGPRSGEVLLVDGIVLEGQLLGCHLLGFAFLPHHFELALFGFLLGMHFLLDASCRFLELR